MSLVWASTALPPPFRVLSTHEVTELHRELSGLTAAEFVSRIQAPAAERQPPLWLGPYTGTVVADSFGMMADDKADELLESLWSIQESISSEEVVLFAASCFQSTRNKQSHLGFAERLEKRLKTLAVSPWQQNERDSGNQCEFRCRAVAALFRLWQGSPANTSWLGEHAVDTTLHPDLRACMIDQLAALLATGSREASSMPQDRPETLRRRQLFGDWPERGTAKERWGVKNWGEELFIPVAKNQNEHPRVRASAVAALGVLLGKQEQLKKLFRTLAEGEENHSHLRSAAIYQLSKFWAGEEWFPGWIAGIISSDQTGSRLASSSLWLLGKHLSTQPSLREQLAPFTADPEKHTRVQFSVLESMVLHGKDAWMSKHLTKIVTDSRLDWAQRRNALRLLAQHFTKDSSVKSLLALLTQSSLENVLVRAEAARGLGQFVRGDPELKTALITLLRSPEEDEKVRLAAFQSAGLVWERQNNLWVKELLLPLASPLEKNIAVRKEALWSIGQIWHESWVPQLYATVCTSSSEPEMLRTITIEAFYHTECRDDWLKQTLLKLAGTEEKCVPVRSKAMWILAQIWRGEPWVAESLLKIAADPLDSTEARRNAIRTFISHYPNSQAERAMLIGIADSPKEPALVRSEAVSALRQLARSGDEITALLLKLVHASESPQELRLAAIEALGYHSTLLSWNDRGLLLQSLAGEGEKDAQIRHKAAYQLALIRESFFGW